MVCKVNLDVQQWFGVIIQKCCRYELQVELELRGRSSRHCLLQRNHFGSTHCNNDV